jgi:hypothetical protein
MNKVRRTRHSGVVFRVVLVLKPFLELAGASNPVGSDLVHQREKLGTKLRIRVEDDAGIDDGLEYGANDLVIHGRPHHQAALFGRIRRPADQPFAVATRVDDQHIREKQGALLQYRIRALRQEFSVAGEEIVLPQMSGKPCAAGRPDDCASDFL